MLTISCNFVRTQQRFIRTYNPYKIFIRFTGNSKDPSKLVAQIANHSVAGNKGQFPVKSQNPYSSTQTNFTEKQNIKPTISTPDKVNQKSNIPGTFDKSLTSLTDNIGNIQPTKGVFKPYTWFMKQNESEKMDYMVKREIVSYGNAGKYGDAGSPRLTVYANQVATAADPMKKPLLKKEIPSEEKTEDIAFVGGSLVVDDSTDIETSTQKHPVFAIKNIQTGDYTIFGMATSQKGTAAGLAGYASTTPLTTKAEGNIEDKKQAQFVRILIPSLKASSLHFVESSEATEFANRPKVIETLLDLFEVSNKYESIPYNPVGFIWDTIATIDELIHRMEDSSQNLDSNITDD